MSSDAKPFVVNLTNCEREPIHIPGSIQPHGVLLALREPELVITHVSDNIATQLGRSAEEVLGVAVDEVIGREFANEVRYALERRRPTDANPLQIRMQDVRFDGIVHRNEGVAFLELERPVAETNRAATHASLRIALADLQQADNVASLCEIVVQAVRDVTGFDRVMLYRFDEDEHGSVEAEAKNDSLEPYLGLHYPASDIPRQARALYLRNWLRAIPDARHTPSHIIPQRRADADLPLDLSLAVLRSVSPIHLEYLANMGVRGSMSVALVVAGQLWGLVLCVHHAGPKFLGFETRSVCETIGRLVSLQIPALEERERSILRDARATTREVLAHAMKRASVDDDVLESLLSQPHALLELVAAEGAAIIGAGAPRTCGRVPSHAFLLALMHWLGERGERAPFCTRSLASSFPDGVTEKDVASGILTVALPGTPQRRIVWFRPEMIHTVTWGGDPRKPMETDPNMRLHPRRSFEKWKEKVSLRSRAWTRSDLEAAEELRRSAVEIDLDRQLMRAHRAVRVRDDLVAVVSHDLKNPLNIIKMQTDMLLQSSDWHGDDAYSLSAAVGRIQRASDRMNALINDLLDLAKIETGRFEMQRNMESFPDLINEALTFLRPLAEAKKITVSYVGIDSCVTNVDRERIFQVLSNIIGNAIKFTPEGGAIMVESRRVAGELWVSITDSGPGIVEDAMPHVFDRYWQAGRARRGAGSGLGLYIAKGILDAHEGRIWVERAQIGGAKFTFALRCAQPVRDEQPPQHG